MPSVDFNYIVSSLPEYVKNFAELISKQLAFGAKTISRVTPRTGIKTSAAINFLGVNVPIQNGRGCGFNPSGSAEISDRKIETAIMKKEIEICPDTLLAKWPEYEVRIPADQRDHLPFEAYLVAEIIKETEEQMEDLVWQGATSAHGGTDLIDGYLTIVDNEATAIKFNVTSGATKIAAVREVIAKIPAKVLRNKAKVFVSPEFYQALGFELVDANLYHFQPSADMDSFIFPGTNVEIINTYGLAGTGKLFAATLDNMYYGTDVEDAERRVKIVYDEKADTFAVKFRWNAGVQVAFPDRVVLATL